MGAKENVFDENGVTVETVVAAAEPETADVSEPVVSDPALPLENSQGKKYRIGEKYFETQDQALEYAQSHIQEQDANAAYQQGMRDMAAQQSVVAPGVTPAPAAELPPPDELYTNPNEYLRKRDEQVEARILSRVEQRDTLKTQSDQIWSEFTQRHPMLADFRSDVEVFVNGNQDVVRGIIAMKGRPASYDFIATKLKAKFEQYSAALKPKRELPNTGAAASPSTKGASVTPQKPTQKPLSFAEQVRSLKKGR